MTPRRVVRVDCIPQSSCEESAVGENDLIWSVRNQKVGRVDVSGDAREKEVEKNVRGHGQSLRICDEKRITAVARGER